MKRIAMPAAGLEVPSIISGQMRIAEKSDHEIIELYRTARDCGIDFFDHADIYGGSPHRCEERFAQALKLSPAEREEITLQTKCGIVPDGPYFDFSYAHIVESVHGSLRALNTEYLDILLLHRPDALVEPEEVARAFDELAQTGKVRHFGVSNHTPGQIELLRSTVEQPLVANQVQLSITHAPVIAQGLAMNMQQSDQSLMRDGGGLIEYSRMSGITLQAWSPFRAAVVDGPFLGNDHFPELNSVIDRLAREKDSTPEGIAVAWLVRHPANIQVVLGTTTPQRVRDSADGSEVELSRAEWYEILRAAGYHVP